MSSSFPKDLPSVKVKDTQIYQPEEENSIFYEGG